MIICICLKKTLKVNNVKIFKSLTSLINKINFQGKIAGLVQKPQQFGLMKRGLGGMTNEELQESRLSYKKEPRQVQTKPAKITAMSLTLADVQQRIGNN